jgi:putative tryptophan/tyrosine transport system substrate-binding protein
MRRREFIALAGSAAATWPLAARAQQPAMPVVGILSTGSAAERAPFIAAFREGLGAAGYVDGRNVAIEFRWGEGRTEQLPAMAAELVNTHVSALFADGPSARSAKAATTTIPIVFTMGGDPVQDGLVASLNRPGGNITGVTVMGVRLEPKRLELLHELVPTATSIAVLLNPNNFTPLESQSRDLEAAARVLGLELHVLKASTERDFDTAFATFAEVGAGGLAIGGDGFFASRSPQLGEMALRHRVPAIAESPNFAAAGGLMSYGASTPDMYRLAGIYVGRILKGEKPADLPVQQAVKVQMTINLKTAKTLGIAVPLPLLGRADEVIE